MKTKIKPVKTASVTVKLKAKPTSQSQMTQKKSPAKMKKC